MRMRSDIITVVLPKTGKSKAVKIVCTCIHIYTCTYMCARCVVDTARTVVYTNKEANQNLIYMFKKAESVAAAGQL